MAILRKGLGPAVAGAFESKWRGGVEEILKGITKEIFVGRVTDIILNHNHPKFKNYGYWNSIGTIFFEAQSEDFVGSNEVPARPLTPQRASFPLVNEMVLIFTLPNKEIGQLSSSTSYFYINVISIWNSPHHNAYPNPLLTSDLPSSMEKDYEQTEAGSTRKVTDEPKEIPLNSPINPSQNTFIEQSNIHPLLPFAGDIIYEGRFGNSIRFGSTAKNPPYPTLNNWSVNGESGNPITIIRNGQDPNPTETSWVPIVEDINKDLSSIYITSNQQIPINVGEWGENYNSYPTPPTIPSQYTQPQVIINSDRLVFNAKTDNILLSAAKSIGLSSNNSLNFNTKNFIVDAGNIKLGSKDATEPLVKGQTLYDNLDLMVKSLIQIVGVLEYNQLWPGGGEKAPDGGTSIVARSTKDALENVKKDLINILSKVSKTI